MGSWIKSLVLAGLLAACVRSGGDRPVALQARAASAYDTVRGVTVVFQGQSAGPGETWEWDGTTWSLRATSGPASREGHAMAYDSARNVTVLFGGFLGSGASSDETWEWDGTTWTLRTSGNSPTARYGHGMVFDAARGETTLFGGSVPSSSSGFLDATTWQWNGTRWRIPRNSEGPSNRTRLALAYDSTREVAVLFGGQGQGGPLGDTWEWDGTRWSQISPALSPSPRDKHALAHDSVRGVTVLFGGFDGELDDETWEWDGTIWTQRTAGLPASRAGHSMAFDVTHEVTYLFGGAGREDEAWGWNGTDWVSMPGLRFQPPSFRVRVIWMSAPGGTEERDDAHPGAPAWLDLRVGPLGRGP